MDNALEKLPLDTPEGEHVRYYEQGFEIDKEFVYLCNCPESGFCKIPWQTKKIYGRFTDKLRAGITYVHVCVSIEEWNNSKDEVIPVRKVKKALPEKISVVIKKPEVLIPQPKEKPKTLIQRTEKKLMLPLLSQF
jgi:hypothetical protein